MTPARARLRRRAEGCEGGVGGFYNPKADDIPAGMIHDFKYKEGALVPGFLNPVRTQLDDYLDDFFFTQATTK